MPELHETLKKPLNRKNPKPLNPKPCMIVFLLKAYLDAHASPGVSECAETVCSAS